MRIEDWGRFDGGVLLFGGACSNAQAVEALMRIELPRLNTGDMVAYGADGAAVVALLAAVPCVAGNCERQIGAGAPDCGCGFAEGSACDLKSGAWYAHALATLGETERERMRACPDLAVFSHLGRRYGVIHGGVTDIARFLWPVSPEAEFIEECLAAEAVLGRLDGIVAGHCGIPFRRTVGRWDWINPGSLGLPPNDGRRETSYAVMERGGVDLRRLAYDWQGARAAMVAAGLTQGYHDALETGWWPSEEILPAALRRQVRASG